MGGRRGIEPRYAHRTAGAALGPNVTLLVYYWFGHEPRPEALRLDRAARASAAALDQRLEEA